MAMDDSAIDRLPQLAAGGMTISFRNCPEISLEIRAGGMVVRSGGELVGICTSGVAAGLLTRMMFASVFPGRSEPGV